MLSLYHLTTLFLSPYHCFDEETLPPPSHYRYGLWLGLFSFCTRHCGSFAGYAYLVRVALYFLLPFSWVLWLTAALVIVFTFAGIWAADKLETYWGEDPSRVVVDIGVHQDGLVHISQVSDKFIRHPSEVVSVGDVVKVAVLEVDEKKKRISLSMKQAR